MTAFWNASYRPVATESSNGHSTIEPDVPVKHFGRISRTTILLASGALITAVMLISLGAYSVIHSTQTNGASKTSSIGRCGNSSAEALSLGCSFDQSTLSWFPPYCPHYANEDFVKMNPEKPWKFYTNPYKKIPATETQWTDILDNKFEIWGERGEHLSHCVFMFRTLGQIVRDSGRFVPKHVNYHHIEHCTNVLLDLVRKDKDFYEIETKVPPISYDQDC